MALTPDGFRSLEEVEVRPLGFPGYRESVPTPFE